MATLRLKALEMTLSRKPVEVKVPEGKTSDYYGMLVFNKFKMQKYLSKEAYEAVMESIEEGNRIDRKIAEQVASGMKAWAMEHGATHYCHWFQPLTDATAEKHDAFIDYADNGGMVEQFSGKLLAQQEPDASSFPSGGIRSTFEARGYTAWDPSSPAFIFDKTLCVPTIFISYTGEALDMKVPLLKALHAVDKAAVAVCHYFDKDVKKVYSYLGWEQEYFMIDEALYQCRPDLILTGRTLLGHHSAKNQQLEDQYFGAIPQRAAAFMKDLEYECWKLGIPAKTKHNEVAPNQFELAPIYEEVNLGVDHNLLLMTLMRKIARRHNFRVLLHEKPFAGINGSGKHNNWSLGTDTGINLYSPGKNPKGNLLFLTFLVNTLMAVYKHNSLMKASVASAGNAHRLGANEAPPAIISAFLGKMLTEMLDQLETKVTDKKLSPSEKTALKLDIGRIPEILLDTTDRNRTSPFAYTGNRFEFRAVGSSMNCAGAMTALNTAIAAQLIDFKKEVDAIIDKGLGKDEAILQVIRKYIKESKPIRFDGNNYSDEWQVEAKKRGLDVEKCVPKMIETYLTPESRKLFKDMKVLSEVELESRNEVKHETYVKKLQIEARVLGDLAVNHIIPTATEYQTDLIKNVQGLKDIFTGEEFKKLAGSKLELIKEIEEHTTAIKEGVEKMVDARKAANKIDHAKDKAMAYHDKVSPWFEKIRDHADALETIVEDEKWPLPKYRELLFIR
jgi:glutamine synthetase